MKTALVFERRIQDLERKFENKERLGKIVDVKFENKRWYVKLNDGEDDNPSGSDKSGGLTPSTETTFKSDWQPWKSFSHGTIKVSMPPKKGQYGLMRSVVGQAELSTVEPHHYGPENPSPHGKEDEVVKLIEHEENSKKTETAPSIFGSGSTGSFASFNASADPISMGLAALQQAGIDPSAINFGPNGIKIPDISSVQGLANQVIGGASDPIGMAKAAIQQAIKSSAGGIMSMLQGKLQGLMQAKNDAKTDKQNMWTRETNNSHHTIIGRKPEQNPKGSSLGEGKKTQESREIPVVPTSGEEKTLQILATDKGWLLTHGKSKSSIMVNQDDIFIVNEKMAFHVNKEEASISKGDTKVSVTEDLVTVTAKGGAKLEMSEDTIKASKGEAMVSVRENAVTGNVGEASSIIQAGSVVSTVGSGSVSVKDGQVFGKVGDNSMVVKNAGAKIAAGSEYVVVTQGGCFSSKPIVVGPDPLGPIT